MIRPLPAPVFVSIEERSNLTPGIRRIEWENPAAAERCVPRSGRMIARVGEADEGKGQEDHHFGGSDVTPSLPPRPKHGHAVKVGRELSVRRHSQRCCQKNIIAA